MQLQSFRIKNFRSIIDTKWVNFSTDNVTAIVGQNESGKTAILEALAKTFSSEVVELDDVRHAQTLPEVWIVTKYSSQEISEAIKAVSNAECHSALVKFYAQNNNIVQWYFPTTADPIDATKLVTEYQIVEPDAVAFLSNLLKNNAIEKSSHLTAEAESVSSENSQVTVDKVVSTNENFGELAKKAYGEILDALFESAPTMVLFTESSGLLPNKVDITDDFKLVSGIGSVAARNFLTIAEIDLKTLVQSNTRARAAILKLANKNFTDNFLKFWSQHTGKKSTLELECAIHHHSAEHEKSGKTYLEFLITDNETPLYPKQRSRGTRWFISFFLQLRASEVQKRNRYFLLDEPGANLHEKAQADVLRLIEIIRESIGVIYSTHSPHLISENSIHRILAVERDPEDPIHPTRVIGSHALGAASTDTLSPILSTMGVALSRQTAIKQKNNVILEELSSYYYLKAFWLLTKCDQEVNLLPATGTSNVTVFAQLFLGWGLDFIIVVDDEGSGRSVYNKLKRDMFLDDQTWASRRMHKISQCEGIEDIFEMSDYKKYILENAQTTINQSNAKWAKANGAAKAIHALKFLQKCQREELTLETLHAETVSKITSLVDAVASRLRDYQ
jgi:ABC-type cobalamin/Fe3+-siderophores transport system ATPase subunit